MYRERLFALSKMFVLSGSLTILGFVHSSKLLSALMTSFLEKSTSPTILSKGCCQERARQRDEHLSQFENGRLSQTKKIKRLWYCVRKHYGLIGRHPPAIPTIAASRVYNGSLFASYSRGDDPRLHGIPGFMTSDWHPTPSKDS